MLFYGVISNRYPFLKDVPMSHHIPPPPLNLGTTNLTLPLCQVVQEPALFVTNGGEVEPDGVRTTTTPSWRDILTRQCTAYTYWLANRETDCLAVLGDGTFARTQLYIHLYLTCLRSFALLLLERDKLHLAKMNKDDIER